MVPPSIGDLQHRSACGERSRRREWGELRVQLLPGGADTFNFEVSFANNYPRKNKSAESCVSKSQSYFQKQKNGTALRRKGLKAGATLRLLLRLSAKSEALSDGPAGARTPQQRTPIRAFLLQEPGLPEAQRAQQRLIKSLN